MAQNTGPSEKDSISLLLIQAQYIYIGINAAVEEGKYQIKHCCLVNSTLEEQVMNAICLIII